MPCSGILDRLIDAYFVEGADIGDPAVLRELAHGVGVDPDGRVPEPEVLPARVGAASRFDFQAGRIIQGTVPAQPLLRALLDACGHPCGGGHRAKDPPTPEGLRRVSQRSDALEDHRDALTPADAHGHEGVAT